MKMWKYVLTPSGKGSMSPQNLRSIWNAITMNKKALQKEYKQKTGMDLEIGRVIVRKRSVVMLIGLGASLNVISDILSVIFHNENVRCRIPYWS